MIALGGPKLKPPLPAVSGAGAFVSMIALGGPKLKHFKISCGHVLTATVSMIALGGPKLKRHDGRQARGRAGFQ